VSPRSRFPLLGEPLALDLLNTWYYHKGRSVDLLPDPAALGEWLAAQGEQIPGPLREPDHEAWAAVVELRGQVKDCVDALRASRPLPKKAVSALNRVAAAAPLHYELQEPKGGPISRQPRRAGKSSEQLAGILAEAAIALLADDRSSTIRQCEGEDCELLFLPGHPRRRWCSPVICGNRARVARHYRRRRPPQGPA
jgi:predicted RNA-binding Zn ribbon-like protein